VTPSLSIIVPTYNEAQTIERFVARLSAAAAALDHELVVVDDSADGTVALLARLAAERPRLRVLHRTGRRGLASAVVEGIAAARGQTLCVMDADLQHPPEYVPALVRALDDAQADVAIASRFVPGGGSDLSAARQVVSGGALACARLLLPRARRVADPMSGFFAFRRRVVDGIELRPIGYKVLLEILVRGRIRRVVEVPYHFAARPAGDSKLGAAQHWEYLRHLGRLWREQRRGPAIARFVAPPASVPPPPPAAPPDPPDPRPDPPDPR
jgi:dolichol-phosphate mannosyltransferase